MKKVLACAVALALVLCMVPMAFAANPDVKLTTEVADGKVMVTITSPVIDELTGLSFFVKFDSNVLEYSGFEPAGETVKGKLYANFAGYVAGLAESTTDTCSFAWTNAESINVDADTAVIGTFTLTIKDTAAETTNVTLVMREFKTASENVITTDTAYAATPVTLKAPAGTTDGPTDGTTEAPGKTALDKLKDAITEAGLTMPSEEELKAILDKIDNGTLDDIKKALQSVFGGADITDLYNKILNLFGKGTTTTAPVGGVTTTKGSGSTTAKTGTTTAKGGSKIDKTGDVGIALAATVCLAAAAAFVLTKKKED